MISTKFYEIAHVKLCKFSLTAIAPQSLWKIQWQVMVALRPLKDVTAVRQLDCWRLTLELLTRETHNYA